MSAPDRKKAARSIAARIDWTPTVLAGGDPRASIVEQVLRLAEYETRARSPQPAEPSTGDLLRAAAAGRREYAGPEREGGSGNAKVDEMREVLLTQAATLDGAAKVADGDMGPLYGWLPSWRWTAAMDQRVLSDSSGETTRADTAALAPAAPLPAVLDGEDAACMNCGLPLGPPEAWGQAQVGPVHHGCPDDAEDGEDVPARLDAAADALAAADLARGAAALRDAASVASIAGPDVRAAVTAALARPVTADGSRPGLCPTCSSAQPHLHPTVDLCPNAWHEPAPATASEWRSEMSRWAGLVEQIADGAAGVDALYRVAAGMRRQAETSLARPTGGGQ